MTDPILVLDTSIAAAWFFSDEPRRDAALGVRKQLMDEPGRFAVPHLFHTELIHVLARKSKGDRKFVGNAAELVVRLGIRTLALSDRALARLCDWSCRGISGYDGTFVALAEDLGGRWITLDARAARKVGPRWALVAT